MSTFIREENGSQPRQQQLQDDNNNNDNNPIETYLNTLGKASKPKLQK